MPEPVGDSDSGLLPADGIAQQPEGIDEDRSRDLREIEASVGCTFL
jgi:hypothetical protein